MSRDLARPWVHPWSLTAVGPVRILPDGCLDVIVGPDGEAFVAGPDAVAREHVGAGRHVGLRFSHGLGPALLGVPADELLGAVVPLRDVVGTSVPRGDDPADALRTWLRGLLAEVPDDDRWAPVAFDASARGVPVPEIAVRLGVSARTLHRRCRARFGYGPQHLARVLRLQRAVAAHAAGASWAATAAVVGYVDQQHLAREVRALTGTTPTGL